MDLKEKRVDLRELTKEEIRKSIFSSELLFKFNQTFTYSEKARALLNQLFNSNIDPSSIIMGPLQGDCFDLVHIGKNCFINSNCLMMARGKIIIEDNVTIAPNVQLITHNHDLYERDVLVCKPIIICKGTYIGAGVTILPGIKIGRYSVIETCSVVTKDVPDYGVVAGNPAKLICILEKEKFEK